MKSINLAVVLDPVETLKPKKDTSLALIAEAERRGWNIYYIELKDLSVINGTARASVRKLTIDLSKMPWYQLGNYQTKELTEFPVILMRKDPPVDTHFLHAVFVLGLAEKAGVLVLNKPQSLLDANEKFFLAHFSQCATDTVFSMNKDILKEFIVKHKQVVLKPLDGMGGKSVFLVKSDDVNVGVTLETLTQDFSKMITAQKYIPEIKNGDKRIILINGEPILYALARFPAPGEHRGNLAAGGIGKVVELTKRDHWICEQVGPVLKEKGLIFVGLDVIGDYLTEVNVTSPTCVREIEAGAKINIAGKFLDYVENKI